MESTSIRLKPSLTQPLPGSLTAFLAGCTCPREINRHGMGAGLFGTSGHKIPYYHVHPQCPLHVDWESYARSLQKLDDSDAAAPPASAAAVAVPATPAAALPTSWLARLRQLLRRFWG